MRLTYVYDGPIPSSAASAVNVVKTCAALGAEGNELWLICGRGPGDLFRTYGVDRRFRKLAISLDRRRRGAVRLYAWLAAMNGWIRGATVYARKPALLTPAARLGCPVALELHSPLTAASPGNKAAFDRLMSSGNLRCVICISQALAADIRGSWPEAGKLIAVAHDGADPITPPRSPQSLGRTRPLLGYAGHLYPGKGMETIAALAQSRPDWDFLVIGGNEEDVERWRSLTKGIDNIDLCGAILHSEVPKRLATADILLAPYGRRVIVSDGHTDVARWMSPLKVFEYMALGKPLVASDLPVLREILQDGENARLAEPDDPTEWERVIHELLADPANAAQIGVRARQDMEGKYSWRCRARAIVDAMSR